MREERDDEAQRTDRQVQLIRADTRSPTNEELAEKILVLEHQLGENDTTGEDRI